MLTPFRPDNLHYWLEHVERLSIKYNKLIGKSASSYVENIVIDYLDSGDVSCVNDAVGLATDLQTAMRQYEAEILEVAGFGEEWEAATDMTELVDTLVRWLEEVLCLAMIHHDDVFNAHERRLLMYQV
jgi:hypothetical protein